MKKVIVAVLSVAVVTGLSWTGVKLYRTHESSAAHPIIPMSSVHPNFPGAANHPAQPPLMTMGEFQKYRSARQAALQANPQLKSDYQDILKQMDGQMDKLDDAMLKADPKLKPVIAKLVALRALHSPHPASPSTSVASKPAAPAPAIQISPEEWQELRAARSAAVQNDTDLMAESKKLAARMRTFESSLDAAMVKADPSVAPMIAKFEAGRMQHALASAAPGKPTPP